MPTASMIWCSPLMRDHLMRDHLKDRHSATLADQLPILTYGYWG
jgi:hypothetical protein